MHFCVAVTQLSIIFQHFAVDEFCFFLCCIELCYNLCVITEILYFTRHSVLYGSCFRVFYQIYQDYL